MRPKNRRLSIQASCSQTVILDNIYPRSYWWRRDSFIGHEIEIGRVRLMLCLVSQLHLMFFGRNILIQGSVLGCAKEDPRFADSSSEEGLVPGRFTGEDKTLNVHRQWISFLLSRFQFSNLACTQRGRGFHLVGGRYLLVALEQSTP